LPGTGDELVEPPPLDAVEAAGGGEEQPVVEAAACPERATN